MQSKLSVLGVYPKYEPSRTDRCWKGKREGKKENPQVLLRHPSHESGEFPAVRPRGRGFFLDGTVPWSHLLSSPRRRTKTTVSLPSHLSRKGGDRPNTSDTPRQAGCPGDKGASPAQGAVASWPKELPCVFSIPCGTELPTSTGSRRDGLGEMKAVGSPAATVVASSCHPCAEMSLHRVGEGGPTGRDEGERVESAIQPRNGKTHQAFPASQLITAGKAISRPCKSFASVYPGTWVTPARSGWGHRRRAAGSTHASGTGRGQ